ncbi:MAG TPA: peptidoglycan DD-metalloendopeptidase family protein [Candidatus Paceibacterota bacterium]
MLINRNIVSVLLILATFSSFSQNEKNVLKKKKENLENIIKQTSSQLNETKKNKQGYLNQVVILNKQISVRQDLISAINLQINVLDNESIKTRDTISKLSKSLESLKKEYSQIIYQAFRTRNEQSMLMFIFSSKSFNQAYLRIKYLQQYTLFRKQQASKIMYITRTLNLKLSFLESQKKEKMLLLKSKESEKVKLFSEKEEQNNTINQLSQKEKMLLKTLRNNEQAVQNLQNAIERIIAEEVRRGNESRKKNNSGSTKLLTGTSRVEKNNAYVYSLTPDEISLSSSFEKNRGRLPWPVDKGTITDFFGEQPHAELKGIMIKNNGINIETNQGANAKVIFDGIVTGVISIPNLNNVVIIRHGEFLSVYSNLKNVTIVKGEKVKTFQSLGTIQTDPSTNKTKIHFEIWRGKVLMNPIGWILK